MADNKITDWEDVPVDDITDWEDVKDVSKTESGLRGLAQGASFGFADELTGGVEALWNAAKGDPRTFGELYKASRDESRANYDAAEQANPKTFMAGQVGGAIGTSLVPGLGGANVAKLGLMGAAQGLGNSDADLTEGDVGGALADTAIGGTIGAATGVAGKGLQKLLPSAEKVASGVINAAEDISNPLANLGRETLESGAVIGQHSTIPGKMFGASNKIEQVLNAVGDIPEATGQAIRETGKAAQKGDLGGILGGVFKSGMGGGKLNDVFEAVGNAGAPRTAEQVGKSAGQRALDYGIGAAATGKVSGGFVPAVAAGSKVAGTGLGAVNKGIFNAANTLSMETVESLAPRLGKYGQVLMNAAQRGGQSALASTDFILQQTDPDYRKALRQAQGIDDEQEEQP